MNLFARVEMSDHLGSDGVILLTPCTTFGATYSAPLTIAFHVEFITGLDISYALLAPFCAHQRSAIVQAVLPIF
jgi:hypothetical protein